jgi:hypothetical protein
MFAPGAILNHKFCAAHTIRFVTHASCNCLIDLLVDHWNDQQ